jgi:hypothetical protein
MDRDCRSAIESVATWKHVGGWVSRGFLALLILFEIEHWLDILVFDAKEYERLIGSESACGVASAYCSWTDFILYNAPLVTTRLLSPLRLPHSWHWLGEPCCAVNRYSRRSPS